VKKTVAIIQARMGSSRLAGKVLQPVAGRPVLWHVVHRLKKCRELDEVRIATTTHSQDDPIIAFAKQEGVPVTRGSEDNVLQRYQLAVDESQADIIIRVTGDAPLIDTTIIDVMLAKMRETGADICGGGGLDADVIHEGFSVVSRRLFDELVRNGGHDPSVREHVIYKFDEYVPDLVPSVITFDPRHFFKGARISVDTPADITFIDTLYDKLEAEPGEIDLGDVVDLLKREPELMRINSHVRQKLGTERSYELLMRCDGGHELGLGHVMRCISVAKSLRDKHSIGIRFVMLDFNGVENHAHELVKREHFALDLIAHDGDEADAITKLMSHDRVAGVVLDIRTSLSVDAVHAWRNNGKVCASLDDPSERRLACDHVFYPPVPQVDDLEWSAFPGTRHIGWNWIALGPSFHRSYQPQSNDVPNVGVIMGGSDTHGLTLSALSALSKCHSECAVHVVLGKASQINDEARALAHETGLVVTFHHDVRDMAAFLSILDMAIASFGVSAYELAASAVPTLLLSISDDHFRSASALDDAGAARSLGLSDAVSTHQLATEIDALLNDTVVRNDMVKAARRLNIHQGADNIAETLHDALKNMRQ